ncbi:hypothetical protein DUNSADRAFT_3963 [Dunaliella salina]|uniref:Uncharacterized protein n=1 Tax=Dunaliella salina TaxID=3046 RepID=A0ABQ7H7V7_DUNSA|nr:hypothetical protein DUNSADRAFT_3963 [Dunaliella salina]|eukprot:KAF5842936.1 hypothetical protein DUNSADRAFT_3963 [Dunaliella salina]
MLAPPPFDSSPFDPSTQTQLAPPTLSTPSTPGLKEGSQNKAAPLAASKPSASGPRPVLEPFNSASPAAASIDAGSFAATGQPAPGTAQHAASSSENAATQGSSSSGACDGAGGDSKMAPSADHVAAADGTAGQTAGGQGGPASPSSPPTSLPTSMKAPPSASAGAAAAAAAVKPSFLQHQQRHQIKQQQPWAPSAPPAPMCQRVPVPPRLQSLHERSPLLWGPAVPKSPLNQATGLLANCCLWFTPFNSITAATLIASKSSLDGLLAELPTSSSIGSSGIQSSSSESSSTSAGNKTEGSPGTKAGSEPGRPVGATTSTTVSGSLQDSTLQQQQHHHHEQQHQEQQHQQQQHQQQQQQHHSCTQEQQQQQQQQQQSHRRTSKQPPLPPLPHRLHLQQLYAQQQALVYGALSLSLHRRILAAVRTRKISPTVLLPLLRSPMLPAHTLDAVRLILEAAQPPIPPPPSHTLSALNPNPGAQGSNGGSSSSASSTRPSSFPPSQFRPISFPTSQLRPNPNKLPTSFRPSNPSLASPPHRDPTHFTHTHNDPPQHQAGHPAPHTPHASDAINPFTSSPSQNHQGASPHQVPSSSSSQVPAHSDNHSGLSGHRPTSPTQGGGARDGGSGNNGAGRPSASAQHTPPGQPQLPAQQVGQPELLSLAHTGLKVRKYTNNSAQHYITLLQNCYYIENQGSAASPDFTTHNSGNAILSEPCSHQTRVRLCDALQELLGRYQRATATHKAKAAGPTPPPAHAQGTAAEARAPVLASPQGASSSAGVVGGITAEAGMAGQSEGQVLQERQQRSQQQQQQQQQQQLQQQAPLRAQQLQLQELRDSVLARPRLGHLIECARMVVDAELSFGGPARAPHALAAVKMGSQSYDASMTVATMPSPRLPAMSFIQLQTWTKVTRAERFSACVGLLCVCTCGSNAFAPLPRSTTKCSSSRALYSRASVTLPPCYHCFR